MLTNLEVSLGDMYTGRTVEVSHSILSTLCPPPNLRDGIIASTIQLPLFDNTSYLDLSIHHIVPAHESPLSSAYLSLEDLMQPHAPRSYHCPSPPDPSKEINAYISSKSHEK